MSGRPSRSKGRRGEYGWRDLLIANGFEARRGLAAAREPDIVHNIEGVHFECKNTERFDVWGAIRQAVGDIAARYPDGHNPYPVPVIPFKRNNEPWRVVLDGDYYLELERLRAIVAEFKELV